MDTPQPQYDGLKVYKKKVWIASAIIALILISFLIFNKIFNLLLLAFAGVLVSVYFHAFASLIRRKIKMAKTAALVIAIAVNLGFLALFFWFVGSQLSAQIVQLSDTLPQTVLHAKQWLANEPLGQKVLDYATNSVDSVKATSTIQSFFSSTFGMISDIYIIILLGAFFTADPEVYRRGFIHLVPTKGKNKASELWNETRILLKNWLKGQIFGFFFITILTGLGLWAIGMPLVLTLALVAGLLNFIPNFGPLLALIPAVLLALMQSPDMALLVLIVYSVIQIIQSTMMQPLIQKKMVSMPPGLLVFGQVGMGFLAGFWGVLLATPLIAIIMILVNKLYVEKQKKNTI